MVAIVTGNGLGLERSSAWVLGSKGQVGVAKLGRANDNVYVNAVNGNLVIQNTDEMLFGLGPNDILTRTYNSLSAYGDGDNNDRWQESSWRHIDSRTGTIGAAGSTVKLIDWDGSDIVYSWDATFVVKKIDGSTITGAYVSKEVAGAYDTLSYDGATSSWMWMDGNSRTTDVYNDYNVNNGRIKTSTDADGNTLTFTYNANDVVIGYADGEFTKLVYSGGQLTRVDAYYYPGNDTSNAAVTRSRVSYAYDAYGRLSSVTVDLTPDNTADSVTYTTTYGYVTASASDKRINLITQTDGSSLSLGYDASNRIDTIIQTVASGVTRKTTLSYTSSTSTDVRQWIDGTNYYTTTLTYSSSTGLLNSIVAPVASGQTVTTNFGYNSNGDVTSITDPSGKGVTYTYDEGVTSPDVPHGNWTTQVDSAGNTIKRTYDKLTNALLTETRYLVPDPDGAGSGVATTPVTTQYAYDSENHLRYVVSAEGRITEYRYNAAGSLIRTIEYLDAIYTGAVVASTLDTWVTNTSNVDPTRVNVTKTDYDFRGNIKTVTTYEYTQSDSEHFGGASGASSVVTYVYDYAGKLLKRTVDGHDETYVYDGLNRVTQSTDFNNVVSKVVFSDATRTDTVKLAFGTANEADSIATYDQAGELITYQEAGTTQTTSYRYDVLGRLRFKTDPTGIKTYFLYDRLGRKVADVAPDGALVEYIYNSDGQLAASVAYKTLLTSGNLTTLTGGSGDLTIVDLASVRPPSDAADRWAWNIYDNAQRLVETISADGSAVVYAYDGANRLVSTTQYANVIDPGTNVADFDGDGRADLIWRNASTGEVYVWKSNGSVAVFTGQSVGTPTSDWVIQQTGDFNGDGRADVIWRNSTTGEVYVWNSNAGASVSFTGYSLGTLSSSWALVAAGDFNGDGKSDILFFNSSTGMYATWDSAGNSVSGGGNLGTASGYTFVGTGDFNGDGKADILFRNNTDGSYANWLISDTTILTGGGTIGTPASGSTFAGTGDFNGDGRTDILFKDSSGNYVTWDVIGATIVGGGNLGNPGAGLTLKEVVDLNSDGKSDLLFMDASGASSSWLVNDTTKTTGPSYSAQSGWNLFANVSGAGTARATLQGFKLNPPTSLVLPVADSTRDRVTRNFYDNDGRLVGTLDAQGYLTRIVYDGAGQKIETIAYATQSPSSYWAAGTLTQLTPSADNANDIHTYFVYDQRGFLRATIDGEGDATTFDYTTLGDVSAVVRGYKLSNTWTPPSTRYTWASLQTALSALTGQTVDKTTFTRNLYGQVLAETRYLATATETDNYTYDELRRLTIATTAAGTADERTYKAQYDARGNLMRELSGAGVVALAALGGSPTQAQIDDIWNKYGVRYSYDDAHRLISRLDADGFTASGNKTLYYYDVDGRLRFQVNALGEVAERRYTNFGDLSDTVVYGARIDSTTLGTLQGSGHTGQITSTLTTAVAALTTNNSTSHVDYNVTGTVSQTIDAMGAVTSFAYNAFRQVTAETDPVDTGVTVQKAFVYDRRGQLLTSTFDPTIVNPSGLNLVTSYLYDAFGRAKQVTDPNGNVRQSTFDRASRVATTTDALGQITTFGYDGRGLLTSRKDRLNNTTTYSLNQFERSVIMTTPEGITVTTAVNPYGQTKTITDGAGRQTTYAYDADGNLTSTVVDPGSGHLNLTSTATYDMAGRLWHSVDANGSTTTYSYDAADRVLSVKVDDGGLNLTTTYEYDAKGLQTKVTDASGVVTQITYDLDGRQIKTQVDPSNLNLTTQYTYRADGSLTKVQQDPSGLNLTTQNTYDTAGRLLTSVVDPGNLALTTTYTYDKDGNVTVKKVKIDSTHDAVTRYVYDGENRLIWAVDPVGDVTKTDYDAEGRVVATTAYAGAVAAATFSGWGTAAVTAAQVSGAVTSSANDEVTRYVYNKDGQVRYTLDANLRATEFVYDGAGNVIRSTDYAASISAPADYGLNTIDPLVQALAGNAANRTTRAIFDGANRQTYSIDALGEVTKFDYDGVGRVTKQTAYINPLTGTYLTNGDIAGLSPSSNDRITRTVYDGAGRVAYSMDALGALIRYDYDRAGRVIKSTAYATLDTDAGEPTYAGLGSWASTHANANDRVTRAYYDTAGRAVYSVDALGYATEQQYDAASRVTKTIQYTAVYSPTDLTDTAALKGMLPTSPPSDAAITVYAYDAASRLTAKTRASGVSTSGSASYAYAYDGASRLVTVTNAIGGVTTNAYDAAGRKTSVTVKIDATTNAVTQFKYDAFGNQVQVIDPRSNSGFFYYDKLNRLVRQVDPEGFVTDTSYSIGDQTTSVTRYANALSASVMATLSATSSWSTTTPTADSNKDESTVITRDKLDRVIETKDAENYKETYVLNAFGERTQVTKWVTQSGGSATLTGVTTNTYDRDGQLIQESIDVHSGPSDTTYATIQNTYGYDAFGEQTQSVEASNSTTLSRTTNFTYDKLGRIVAKTAGTAVSVLDTSNFTSTNTVTPTEQTVYDSRGNVWETIDANSKATFYYYDLLDQKIAQVDALGDYSSWGYDGAGNVTSSRIYGAVVATLPTSPSTSPPSAPGTAYRETTYAYDLASRQTGTSIAGVLTGQYNGSSYSTNTVTLTTSTWYDLAGNVIKQTDARGANVYSFYDKRGKKVLQVDQEGYVTAYVKGDTDNTLGLNTDGNVMAERRFATKISTTTLDGYTNTQLASASASSLLPSNNAADRVTEFAYDRNGHRTMEKRKHVAYSSVDGSGTVTSSTDADATVNYTYNGLGEVATKQEATGDVTTYAYDSMGRLLTETGPVVTVYVDSSNQAVTGQQRRTTYAYDALNNVLSTTIQRVNNGVLVSDTNNDQVTTYAYEDHTGRLTSVSQATDATHVFTRSYAYDAAGHVVRESYSRVTNGSPVNEASLTKYDALGRVVMQAKAAYNAAWSTVTFGDRTELRYDTYGEVTGKGVNVTAGPNGLNGVLGGQYQETFDYDAAGRLWRTTSGNGSMKLFISDAAGNVTMQITSTGGDLSSYNAPSTLTSALTASGSVQLISVYDKRGKVTSTLAPSRTIADSTSFATTTQNLTTAQAYNAFGEVTSQTDARNATTTFVYNTMGRLVQTTHPSVNVTSASGVTTAQTPIEYSAYDLGGRLVMVTDANGNVSKRLLMAGTGYGGTDPTVLKEFRADSSTSIVAYDIWGNDRRASILFSSTEYQVETRDYDRQGNLTVLTRPSRSASNPGGALAGLVEYYAYDGLGQRIQHWNSLLVDGSNNALVEKTDYDLQGRVISQIDFLGLTTTTTYDWQYDLTTTGLATADTNYAGKYGGWKKTVTSPAFVGNTSTHHTMVDYTDYFGRTTSHTDLGGNTRASGYNLAGWLTSFGSVLTYSYYNTGLMSGMTDANAVTDVYFKGRFPSMTYESSKTLIGNFYYDANGNRVGETLDAYVVGWRDYLDSEHQPVHEEVDGTYNVSQGKGAYDAMNRLTQYVSGTQVTVNLKYDAVGNVRNINSVFYYVGAGSTTTQDYWYKYDSMNRFTTTMGQLSGGVISRGTAGVGKDITYDGAGQRASVTTTTVVSGININHVETYSYTEDGYLTKVNIQDGTGYNLTRAIDIRDKMGRVTTHTEYLSNGSISGGNETLGTVEYTRYNVVYDADSKVLSDSTSTIVSGNTYVANTTYYYGADNGSGVFTGAYQGGQLMATVTTNYKNGTSQPTSSYSYDYLWQDAARQNWIKYTPDTSVPGTYNYTTYAYDELGHLGRIYINDGRPRTIEFSTDLMGQVLSRTEYSGYPGAGTTDGPKSLYYYFNGRAMGDISNDGPSSYDYATAISKRASSPSSNQWRNGSSVNYANFDDNYAAINPASQGEAATGSSITVKDGDTLQSIAASVWGDSSLWYLIADANGLDSTTPLVGGMTLTVPAKVTNLHNSSSTFRVYNPNEAIGDVQPNQPKPPTKKDGCGQMFVAIIAIVVAAIILGPIANFLAPMAGGIAGGLAAVGVPLAFAVPAAMVATGAIIGATVAAVSTAVAQGVAVATHIQDKFDWKAVGMAAIAGAIGSGLGVTGFGGDGITGAVVRGATSSVLTQGVEIATGMQHKFDWTGVAVGAVSAGVGEWVGGWSALSNASAPTRVFVTGAASGIAAAATRSAIDGTDFGDNLVAELPGVIGNTLGNIFAGRLAKRPEKLKAGTDTKAFIDDAAKLAGSDGGSSGESSGFTLTPTPASTAAFRKMAGLDEFDARINTMLADLDGLLDKLGDGSPGAPRGNTRNHGQSTVVGVVNTKGEATFSTAGGTHVVLIKKVDSPNGLPSYFAKINGVETYITYDLSSGMILSGDRPGLYFDPYVDGVTITGKGPSAQQKAENSRNSWLLLAAESGGPAPPGALDAPKQQTMFGWEISLKYPDQGTDVIGTGALRTNDVHVRSFLLPHEDGKIDRIRVFDQTHYEDVDINYTYGPDKQNGWQDLKTFAGTQLFIPTAATAFKIMAENNPDTKWMGYVVMAYSFMLDAPAILAGAEEGLAATATMFRGNPVRMAAVSGDGGAIALGTVTESGEASVAAPVTSASSRAEEGATIGNVLPPGTTYEGRAYRAVGNGFDPLEIHPGNIAAPHRYSGPGEGALYFGNNETVVGAEFTGNGASLEGTTMHSWDVKLDGMLDLRNPQVRDSLGIKLDDITRVGGTKEWRYQYTQPLGTYARQSGYRGILAPSAQTDSGFNIILFSGLPPR